MGDVLHRKKSATEANWVIWCREKSRADWRTVAEKRTRGFWGC